MGRIAEWVHGDKVKVPREAATPEFLELARRALTSLPGWPSDTERALRSLVRAGSGAPVHHPGIVRTPAAPKQLPPRPPSK